MVKLSQYFSLKNQFALEKSYSYLYNINKATITNTIQECRRYHDLLNLFYLFLFVSLVMGEISLSILELGFQEYSKFCVIYNTTLK